MDNNNKMKLEKKIKIAGTIEALTGLHIGGSNQGLEIGGIDNAIVRDPITNEPYIPGSSLKGKIRSLIEKEMGIPKENNKNWTDQGICQDPNEPVAQVFGLPAEKHEDKNKQPSSRLIVRDAYLRNDWVNKLKESKTTDAPFTEVKTEIVVDRITAAATPRPVERVPKGAIFEFEMILNVFSADDDEVFINLLKKGIQLLNDDYLGGSGTRGSGKVDVQIQNKQYKDSSFYEGAKDWEPYSI